MIQIKNTKNLLGVTLLGDYEDFNQLYDSISHYLNFYFENKYRMLNNSAENPKGSPQESQRELQLLKDMHECILGLCYDLRHAWQGDRDTIYIESGTESHENLYFSFNVLYPWILYYLTHLGQILDDWYLPDWIEHAPFPYSIQHLQYDRSMIQFFLNSIWVNLQETLGEETADALFHYYEEYAEYYPGGSIYAIGMCYYYAAQTKEKSLEFKKKMLTIMCYEMMITDRMIDDEYASSNPDESDKILEISRTVYDNAFTDIEETLGNSLIQYDSFLCELHDFLEKKGRKTFSDSEQFFRETFGDVNWETLEW